MINVSGIAYFKKRGVPRCSVICFTVQFLKRTLIKGPNGVMWTIFTFCPLYPHCTDRNFYSLRKTLPMCRGHSGLARHAARAVINPEEYMTTCVTRANVCCKNRKWLYSLIYVLFKKTKTKLALISGRAATKGAETASDHRLRVR